MIKRDDFKAALGAPDAGFNRAVDAALREIREREERPVMKRKISIGLIAAVIAVLTLTGAALAVGLNLFELFGKYDARLREIAPETQLQGEMPAEVESDEIGTTHAEFDSAYYDGQTLIVGYTIDNYLRYERYEPTPEALDAMDVEPDFAIVVEEPRRDDGILDDFARAIGRGEAFGYVEYTLDVTDHCLTDDGVDLPPSTENMREAPDGKLCRLREFETPLPEAAQNRDSLTIRMPLKLYAHYVYFDGEQYYAAYESQDAGEITAVVKRSDGETRNFEGTGEVAGAKIEARAQASKVHGKLSLRLAEGELPDPLALMPEGFDEDAWYVFELSDESGEVLAFSGGVEGDGVLEADYDGTGSLPGRLWLNVYVEGEGDPEPGRVRANDAPIALEPVR